MENFEKIVYCIALGICAGVMAGYFMARNDTYYYRSELCDAMQENAFLRATLRVKDGVSRPNGE
jgi:hypothetical protein